MCIASHLPHHPEKNVNTTTNLPQDQRKNFIEQVSRAVETIKGETFEKVVLSNAFTLQYTGETLEVFYRMVHQYSNAFVYYWFHPQTGTWLGATERFLSLENEQLSTMALAGTLPTATATWSKKEIHEQQLVVASIQQGLSRYVPDHKIKIGERETVHAGEATPFVHPHSSRGSLVFPWRYWFKNCIPPLR